eukprot:TRINITY_DN11977_c0_g1_i2.p1 TRINITY_DN11977_c0_g1~~TRINITY_DN11977_c0_g1_i2.p1  ORF type:complete len:156 (+),score=16.03 TRINITY_DN11977_c0_g1_i2:32-499(+)
MACFSWSLLVCVFFFLHAASAVDNTTIVNVCQACSIKLGAKSCGSSLNNRQCIDARVGSCVAMPLNCGNGQYYSILSYPSSLTYKFTFYSDSNCADPLNQDYTLQCAHCPKNDVRNDWLYMNDNQDSCVNAAHTIRTTLVPLLSFVIGIIVVLNV